jgi:hypothetical protein
MMAEVKRWTAEVQSWPETPGKHMMYFETVESAKLQGACDQLFGEPAVLFKDKINFKMRVWWV